MKGLIKRIPVLGPLARSVYHRARSARERAAEQAMLRGVHHGYGGRIASVLDQLRAGAPAGADGRVAAIEEERAALLARDEPLVDDTLGEGGLYDEGVRIDAACRVSKPPDAARFLYLLMREFRPRHVIELGTNVGISSAYLAAGLAAEGHGGRVVTLEASPYRLRLARELHVRVGLGNLDYRQGLFSDTLDDAIAEFGPFDFAFIDGHHQYAPTLDYFERVWRHSQEEALFVFDDIRWSEGMKRAWAQLRSDARIALAVDLKSVGVCVARRDPRDGGPEFVGPLRYALEGI